MSLESVKKYAARISVVLPALFPITLWFLAGFIVVKLVKPLGLFKVRDSYTEITSFQEMSGS
jgi:hypothetical protein